MNAPERLRVVIIGAGMIGEVHRRAILLAGGELSGVMASSPDRSDQVAASWNTAALHDVEALIAAAPDVVHVCSPNALHGAHVEAALAAGAHVICEKPLSVGTADAARLVTQAASTGKIATVPFVYRFHPLVREVRARVEAGEFGRWQLLHGSYLQDWLLDPSATSWRVDAAKGGALPNFR
ncbi:Gfo/Idh/MocA family protein [Arthrobacter sp. SD76]|uniref:Gfo/Idh/MocA family protein n=1 Tax=Arthrobacter sp. SD76 TaxID=3415007 RepID=UPI003C73116D